MAKLMGKEITIFFVKLCIYQLAYAAITPLDTSYTATKDEDFNIPWSYDNEANMKTVDWTYKSSSTATPTTIMSKVGTAAETVFNNYNVEYVNNGEIKLKSVTIENAGIYYCEVNYDLSSGHDAVTGTVTLSVTGSVWPKDCDERVIASIVIGSLGIIALAVAIIFILVKIDCSKPDCQYVVVLALLVLCIVFDIISLALSASVLDDKDCKDCPDWILNSAIAFVVVPSSVAVAAIVLIILICCGVIEPGETAYKAKEAKDPCENDRMAETSN